MDELIHYYSVDVAVTFDIDLDSDQIDTELTSDIHDTFVEELQEAFNNNSDVELDDYDWGWDKEHDYIQYLYISSKLDKAAVTPVVENILDSIISFERTDELWDGTYYYERHGLDTPPYERVANTRDYTYKVNVDTDILRFFETNEEGDVLQEAVTKNELKDRAKKHAKKQNGLSPFCSLGERLDRKSIDKNRLDIARLLGIPSGGITVNENGRVEIHNIPEEDARRYSNLLRNKVKDIRLIPGKYDFRKVPLHGQVPDRLVTISGMLKDSLNEEVLNEVKEFRDYKGYEMRADYDVDPEDGIMSLVVHLYKDGKEIQQDAYGRELSFENYRKAREWIDKNAKPCTALEKANQLKNLIDSSHGVQIISILKSHDGLILVEEDNYAPVMDEWQRWYLTNDFRYSIVLHHKIFPQQYNDEHYSKEDKQWVLDNLNFTIEDDVNDKDESPAVILKNVLKYPFTESPFTDTGRGLENFIDAVDRTTGLLGVNGISEEDIARLKDAYDCSNPWGYDEDLDESLIEARKKKKKRLGGTLNPDAGNVEHNINMFNHMNSPLDGPSNNPVSGPFGGDVSVGDAGCCESVVNKRYHAPFPENRRDIVREMKLPLNQKFRKIARNGRVTAEFYVLDGGEGLVDVCDKDDGSMVEVGFSTLENALKYCEICCGSSSTRARKSLLSDGIYVQMDYNLMNALKPMIESGVKLDPGYDGEAVFIYTDSNPEQLIKKYHLSEFDVGNYNGDRVEYYGRSIKKDLGHDIDPRYLEPDTTTSYRDALVAGHAFRREIADYAQSNDDADYRAGVYENLNDIEKNEKVFMEEYDFTNIDTTYTKEVGMNDYFESMNKEDNE